MLFIEIARTSRSVAESSGRRQKIAHLAALLKQLAPDEIPGAVALLSGTPRQGRLGVGHALIASAGDVVSAGVPTLTIADVDRALDDLAAVAGSGAAANRHHRLANLFKRATADEQSFLRAVLHGDLRQGALAGVLTDAIAHAAGVRAETVRRAAMMEGDLGRVAAIALTEGGAALDAAGVRVMRPVQPMLAASADNLPLALAELEAASLEYKLDGARIQVHKAGDDIRAFSRTLRDVTGSVPEVVSLMRALPARQLILDGEVLAMNADGTPQPFQETMRRFGRSRDVKAGRRERPLTPFFFDCLVIDGETLVDRPLEDRAAALLNTAGPFAVPRITRPTAVEAETFASEALARGHEGLMAKDLTSAYAAGRRGSAWKKIKQARTLDLVVLAAEWGNGRRQGWLSNLHLGARDPRTGAFVMLGKTFKGMTDEMLAWQTDRLLGLGLGLARERHVVHVRPELVVEIAFNEVQRSPVYPGGVALRFARVKRYRLDKPAGEVDTIDTVRAMAHLA